MASAIDLTLDDDDSVELMGPPVTDLTADSQDSLPPPRRGPATVAPAAAPVATESQQEAPAALPVAPDAAAADSAPAPAPATDAPPDAPPPPPPRPGTLLARKAKFSYFDTFEDTDDELETTHELRIESAREDDQKIRCACFADLHRHQWDKAYFVGDGEDRRRVDTAEWFRDHAPADIGLAIFAGDLGLEQNDELATESGRGIDRRAKGIDETGHEKELASVEAWATLFRDIIDARPRCHIIVIGGNHDGLLCDDDLCDSCGAMDRVAHRWQTERRRPWGRTARQATDSVVRLLQGSHPGQVHVLRETHVDVDVETIGGGTSPLRVIGSPVTPLIPLTDQQGEAQTGARLRGVRRVTGRPVIDVRARRPVGGDGSGSVGSAGSGAAGRRAFQARWSVDAALSDAWAARRAAWKRVRERGVVARGAGGGVAAQEGRFRGGGGVGGGVGTMSAPRGVGTTLETRKRPRVSVATSGDAGAEVAACSGQSRCGVSARGDGNGASLDKSGSQEMRRVDRGVVVWRSRRALQRRAKAMRSAWRRRSMRPRARAWSGVTSTCFASRIRSASSRSSAGRPSTKRAAPSLESASPAAAAAAQTRRRGPRSCVCRASRAAAASAPPIHASRAC